MKLLAGHTVKATELHLIEIKIDSGNGRIRLSVSTVNRTYELSGITHVTPFREYGKHSTGSSTYGPWSRTYSKLFSCKPVLTVCSYGAQSNEICTYGSVSRGTIPRVRRYGLLYLRTVEYDHWLDAVELPELKSRLIQAMTWCRGITWIESRLIQVMTWCRGITWIEIKIDSGNDLMPWNYLNWNQDWFR